MLEFDTLRMSAYDAAYHGHYTILEYLLEKGICDSDICIRAATGGHIECLKLSYKYKCLKTRDDFDSVRIFDYI